MYDLWAYTVDRRAEIFHLSSLEWNFSNKWNMKFIAQSFSIWSQIQIFISTNEQIHSFVFYVERHHEFVHILHKTNIFSRSLNFVFIISMDFICIGGMYDTQWHFYGGKPPMSHWLRSAMVFFMLLMKWNHHERMNEWIQISFGRVCVRSHLDCQ